MKKIVISLIMIVFIAVCFADNKKRDPFSFYSMFPKNQQKSMGLYKLSKKEKIALWKRVKKLMMDSYIIGNGEKQQSTLPATVNGLYMGVGSGHWISKNIDSGAFIILEDGSLWEVDTMEKINTMLWLPISNITVVESSNGSLGYDYLLINTDDGEKAHAKYMGRK